MRWFRMLPLRCRSLLSKGRVERELTDELRFHLEKLVEEKLAQGMTPQDARHAALRELGGVEQIKEECRDMRRVNHVECFLRDIRYGIRQLRRNPGFTAVAVLTLAAGIGVNTTLFTAVNAVALRPAPGRNPEQFVRLTRQIQQGYGGTLFSYPEYSYYRDANAVFSGLIARACCNDVVVSGLPVSMSGADSSASAERASASLVSGNFFRVLGVGVARGRDFLPEEDQIPPAHAVVIISHRFWKAHFRSNENPVGKMLFINDTPFTIIGITAPDFVGTADPPVSSDLWVPFAMQAAVVPGSDWLHGIGEYQARIVGRLKPGTSAQQAAAELTVLARQFARLHPENTHTGSTVGINVAHASFMDFNGTGSQFVALMALLTAAVTMVLLIACANVANLFLARAVSRRKEIAVRLALGASRTRLVRQLVSEGIPTALLGGAAGLLFSVWACGLAWRAVEQTIRNLSGMDFILSVGPDFRVFAFTLLISVAAAFFFGLAPALQSTKLAVSAPLNDEGIHSGQSLIGSRFRSGLIVGQVAASLILLSGAGLLVRGLLRAESVNPGFETKNVACFELELNNLRHNQVHLDLLYSRILDRLRTTPGVESVALASHIPLLGAGSTSVVPEQTHAAPRDLPTKSFYTVVSPGYFSTLNIPVVRGRGFTEQDMNGLSVIVSESTTRRLWPGEDPIGKRVKTDRSAAPFEVVGIARDIRSVRLSEPDPVLLYFPLTTSDLLTPDLDLFVRTAQEPQHALPALLSAMARIDRQLPQATSGFHGLEDALWFQKVPSRVGAAVGIVLGCFALLLSVMGIYGLVSYVVTQKTREIGIRMALGADRVSVLKLVLWRVTRLVGIGMGLGLAGAVVIARILASALAGDVGSPNLLFGLSWLDPVAFGSTGLLIVFAALFASYIPARRSMKVDPMVALRYE